MMNIDELHKLYLKHPHVFTDSRKAEAGGIFFALKGERFDGNRFVADALNDGADFAVTDDPAFNLREGCIVVDNVLKTLQLLAGYHRKFLGTPVLAITGTNGKTTTKELIREVLTERYKVISTSGNLNNHIGVPLTLLSMRKEHEIAIVEMGANHLGEIAELCAIAEPDYGLITNVGKAHLEGFGSFEGVKKTKGELYEYIASNGKGIFINADNKHLEKMSVHNQIKYTYGSFSPGADLKGEPVDEQLFLVVKVLFPKGWLYMKSKLIGAYNFENIMAAARIGLFFDIDPVKIQNAIASYEPDNNRSQLLKKSGANILIDCYNANPTSMQASVKNFINIRHDNKVVVLGDMLELGAVSAVEHQRIVDLLKDAGIQKVFLVGHNFEKTQAPDCFKKFTNVEALINELESLDWNNKLLLIKGSRGIKLEKIIDYM
ncbi:MAG TPA: UDP-N-acetylmuramoyl-tripeptide--D-alanyl-D-alanine ligase [Prolixibacteraceae bacterium]|nr:UDP-N-acetylmuramoyl-tripeptide--D-alanyl-D-alanine ligase [Prolixibacteraceae bacterium]